MATSHAETVMCIYRVQAQKEAEFRSLLRSHWPTLRRLGVVTDTPPLHFRGQDGPGQPFYVEIFQWKDDEAFTIAHQHPEVLAIWEPMEALAESRGHRPAMEFPHVEPVHLDLEPA